MDIESVDEQTRILVSRGHKVFQIHRFGNTEKTHVSRLLRWAEFPLRGKVVDMGSGTGEVASIMHALRDDLTFTLVNISQAQLEYSPRGMARHCCSFCAVPELDGTFDAAMFCFSIGHEDYRKGLQEAHRLLRAGGILFIYDMARIYGDNASMECVAYRVGDRGKIEQTAFDAGFSLDFYMEPQDSGEYGRSVLGGDFDKVFSGTIPAVWRFVK